MAEVTGPMVATTGGTASVPKAATKCSTVDDEVKHTASASRTACAARLGDRRRPPSGRRPPPPPTSRARPARPAPRRGPPRPAPTGRGPGPGGNASTRPSPTNRSGTRSATTLPSARAAAVAGPDRGHRTPPRSRASRSAASSRRAPLGEVTTTQSNSPSRATAARQADSPVGRVDDLDRRAPPPARRRDGPGRRPSRRSGPRPGHHHPAAEQRPRLEPGQIDGRHLAHHDGARGPPTGGHPGWPAWPEPCAARAGSPTARRPPACPGPARPPSAGRRWRASGRPP